MSVINYATDQARVNNIHWAVQVALEQALGTTHVSVTPDEMRVLERLGIKPRVYSTNVGDERRYWVEYSPLAPRLLTQAIIAANAQSWNLYEPGADPLAPEAVDMVRRPERPVGVSDGDALRAAWTILTALRYNIDERAPLGRFAREALNKLVDQVAYQVMHVDVEGF